MKKNSINPNANRYLSRGFTLVELLVVLGLFSMISVLSLGALFNAQKINGRLQETQSIIDNINLSTQTITRDVRFGSEFYCDTTLPATVPTVRRNCVYGVGVAAGKALIFRPSESTDYRDRVAYYVSNGILFKDEYPFGKASSTLQMTSDDVTITNLAFYVDGAQSSDGSVDFGGVTDLKQPIVTLLLSGKTNPASGGTSISFSVQTSISARDVDNK